MKATIFLIGYACCLLLTCFGVWQVFQAFLMRKRVAWMDADNSRAGLYGLLIMFGIAGLNAASVLFFVELPRSLAAMLNVLFGFGNVGSGIVAKIGLCGVFWGIWILLHGVLLYMKRRPVTAEELEKMKKEHALPAGGRITLMIFVIVILLTFVYTVKSICF